MRVLVTGANGFIGRALVAGLAARNITFRAAVRGHGLSFCHDDHVIVSDINANTDWHDALIGVTHIVHLAARAHITSQGFEDPLEVFRAVNTEGLLNLARQAAQAGVSRFVFLSTCKVYGEGRDYAYTEKCEPSPQDHYALSKWEAELGLNNIATHTAMETVILRSPLVYGPGVKGNFASMLRWLNSGVPLPLAGVSENRRSLLALDNLLDLIMTCLSQPAAANQTFLMSDGEDLSTAELLRRSAGALGRPARLFNLPPALLKLGARLMNKPGIYQRLCGSMQLDISMTRQLLGWNPPVSVAEGLRRAAEGFQ